MRVGEVAAAFEQRYLAGDLAAAERLFRERPMTVYECLAPETAASLSADTDEELADYPWLRMLRTLLGSANPESLRSVRAWLLEFRDDDVPFETAATAAALSAVISVRLGDPEGAEQGSRFVLDESPRNPRTGAPLPEARLIATLVSIRCGYAWALDGPEPEITGRLAPLSAELTRYLRRSRCETRDEIDVPNEDADHPAGLGYRALVLSENELRHRTAALRALDAAMLRERHLDARGDSGGDTSAGVDASAGPDAPVGPEHTDPELVGPEQLARIHGPLGAFIVAGMRLAHDGSRATLRSAGSNRAGRLDDRIVDAMTLLSMGQPERVLTGLSGCESRHPRIHAVIAILRLGALVSHGSPVGTAVAADECVALPEAARIFAATLLPDAVLADIIEAVPTLAPTARRARDVGIAGTGRVIRGGQRLVALSAREVEVVKAMKRGLTLEAIARDQFVSVNTVKTQARSAAKKLNTHGREQLIAVATLLGLVD